MAINLYKVIISPEAAQELDRFYGYIANELHDEDAALRLMAKIEHQVMQLELFPNKHELCIEKGFHGYHKMPIARYICIYRIDEALKVVFVAHFFHSLQDWAALAPTDLTH